MKVSKFKKICIVTGNRAEYGLLRNLIIKLNKTNSIMLYLIITGTHLSKKYGNTYQEIKRDRIKNKIKIDIKLKKDTTKNIIYSMSQGLIKFSSTFKKIKPDLLIVLGDRYEIMIASISAAMNRIPIAHIHGGESTEGVIDELLRHSITKLSQIHFTTCDLYKKRIIQMGENSKNVFNVGSLGAEAIKKIKLFTKPELEKSMNIKLKKKNIIVSYHPETLNLKSSKKNFIEMLKALEGLKETLIIFTMPNSDEGSEFIFTHIKKFLKRKKNCYFIRSLGQRNFLSCLKYFDFIIGNSSSGIIEMPSFNKATININPRQNGRFKNKTIIDVEGNSKKIMKAINLAYSNKFKKVLKNSKNIFDNGNTSDKILKKIRSINSNKILIKKFHDLKF